MDARGSGIRNRYPKDMFMYPRYKKIVSYPPGGSGYNRHRATEGNWIMERFLDAYIGRMSGHFRGFPAATAHEIASSFLAYKFGLYEKAMSECANAIALIPDSPANAALKKALTILKDTADDRVNSRITTELVHPFTDAERAYLAVTVLPERNDDPVTLEIDNAFILVYVVALITSADDEEALGEYHILILRLLETYKSAMGME